MRPASVFQPYRASHLLARFIREVESVGRIETEAAASREEGSSDGGDCLGWPRIGSVHVSVAVVEVLCGRGRGGVRCCLPKRTETEQLQVGARLLPVGDGHR